jgi:hypothetical protein
MTVKIGNLWIGALVIATTISCSGCGLVFQTVVGWHCETRIRTVETRTVPIQSTPPGASAYRIVADGSKTSLGLTPLGDEVSYEVETTIVEPHIAPLLIGGAVDILAGVPLALVGLGMGLSRLFERPDPAALPIFLSGAGLALVGAPVDLITALIYGLVSEKESRTEPIDTPTFVYGAHLDGFRDARAEIRPPGQDHLELVLEPAR